MFCTKCGSKCEKENRFCGSCGSSTVSNEELKTMDEKKKVLPMKFFWFIVYVFFPLIIVANIFPLFFGKFGTLTIAILCLLMQLELRKYKRWALNALFCILILYLILLASSLFLFPYLFPEEAQQNIGLLTLLPAFVINALIGVCTYIYFYKRRHLFKEKITEKQKWAAFWSCLIVIAAWQAWENRTSSIFLISMLIAFETPIALTIYFFMKQRRTAGRIMILNIFLLPVLVSFVFALFSPCQKYERNVYRAPFSSSASNTEELGLIPRIGIRMAIPFRLGCINSHRNNGTPN